MSELNISNDFTIIDIHKIREFNYEKRKNMTISDSIAERQKSAKEMIFLINKAKKK